MPDAILSLERQWANVNGNMGMHDLIRSMASAIDRLTADVTRLEGEMVGLRARLSKAENAVTRA